MNPDATCYCGRPSTRFCTCQKPMKVYLCNEHITAHVVTLGSHTLFSAQTRDLLDADLQNSRRRFVHDFQSRLTAFSEQITTQWGTLSDSIQDMYTSHCERLHTEYCRAGDQIYELYQRMWTSVERVKSEITALETTMEVQLSSEAQRYVQLYCHPEKDPLSFLSPVDQIAGSLAGDPIISFAELTRNWECDSEECVLCPSIFNELKLATPLMAMWKCICGVDNLKDSVICIACEKPKVEDRKRKSVKLGVKVEVGAKGWVCKGCGEQNRPSGNVCEICLMKNQIFTAITAAIPQ